MENREIPSPLRYLSDGRSGTIYFESKETSFDMWYELAMPPAIIIIGIPEAKYWEAKTKTSLSRRLPILDWIGRQIITDKRSGEGYYTLTDNILSICRGKNPELISEPVQQMAVYKERIFRPHPTKEHMKSLLVYLVLSASALTKTFAQTEAYQKSLNSYVAFLTQSTEVVTTRFQMLQTYKANVDRYQKKPDFLLNLPSSGPLEEYYYNNSLSGSGLSTADKKLLDFGSKEIWELINRLDETAKRLETYVRLKTYQADNLKQSDVYIADIQQNMEEFSKAKASFYLEIQKTNSRLQAYSQSDPYLKMQKEMEHVLLSQEQLMNELPFYLNEKIAAPWPVEKVKQSILSDQILLADFDNAIGKLTYPASSFANDFKAGLREIQTLKKKAIDDHNFAAKQSAQHGNEVYLQLLNQYNHDLLASHKAFVKASPTRLLDHPSFSPSVTTEQLTKTNETTFSVKPFQDKPIPAFTIKKSAVPATSSMNQTLNDYVDFINESLRQMHLLQVLLRNYQSSAEYHRDPSASQKRAVLTYAHDDFKVPVSAHQLLVSASASIAQPYRTSIVTQAEVLFNMLKEMDELSIELILYTAEKKYLKDQLLRSDAILDRYAEIFTIFDGKKEELYQDLRRVHGSYPNAKPASSWYISGSALLNTIDNNHDILSGVKSFLKNESPQIPSTSKLEADARKLVEDEYQNMKGLQRFGRSNGLCPYSPYEDLASNSERFAGLAQKVKPMPVNGNPYESFYYFYNNELIYQYNKFVELANCGLLKAINQPDVFLFRRVSNQKPPARPVAKTEVKTSEPSVEPTRSKKSESDRKLSNAKLEKPVENGSVQTSAPGRDTVYVERVRVDTVYVDRASGNDGVNRSLNGFAANNMILLLDVSASMNSPYKMPLLKQSIKSLLTELRAEDQISIVLYSGKARVVLKPTSGAKSAEIARMIDLLQSSGDTDGNEGLRLAYKVANKQYIRGGNNRIVLATDGEFPVSDEALKLVDENAGKDVFLSVFTFGRNAHTGQKLKKLSQTGQGTYAHVTAGSADLQLILEAQAKKKP